MPNPPKALILIGGKSRRMGTEKAHLIFDGQSLLERTTTTLAQQVKEIYLSIAYDETRRFPFPTFRDASADSGPLGALKAAFNAHPDSAWLVAACDLPLLDGKTLEFLLSHAKADQKATCFRNRLDQSPEPLFTLYKPSAYSALDAYLAGGNRHVRRFLESLSPQILALPNPLALENANRPEHLAELRILARQGLEEKSVRIKYSGQVFGGLTVRPEEKVTAAATLAGLYEELRLTHRLRPDLDEVSPQSEGECIPWITPLSSGAKITFVSPVVI